MKKFFVLAVAIGWQLSSIAQNQWQWLNPKPSGAACLNVTFTDRLTGYILNNNGDLLRTVDQGSHWSVYENFPNASVMQIADSTGIIACSNGTVYASSDNGVTWHTSYTGSNIVWAGLSIASRDTIFLSNYSGQLFKSDDGGHTWNQLGINVAPLRAFCFPNSRVGYVGSAESTIYKTEDGGISWRKVDSSNLSLGIVGINFANADTGYVCKEFDSVLVTHDGGKTWASATSYQQASVIDIVNDTLTYVGGEDGLIARSGDGGRTYTSVTPPNGFKDGYEIYALAFVAPDTGFAVGLLGRILKTTDGGQTWNTYSPTYIPVTAVTFPTPSTGYATTWNNIYKTTDGGQTWDSLGLTTGTAYASSSRFEQAHFLNADTGYVTSSSSVQLHWTTDGGQTWTTSNPAPYSYDNVIGMSYLTPDTGYISLEETGACCSGIIEKTTNGGQTWTPTWGAQYNGQYFSDITYVDANTVYGIQYYQLYKSTDGGQTWNVVFTADYYQLTGVSFTDKNNGYLADENGYIHITRDGGQTWQTVTYPNNMIVPGPITAIRFFNGAIGYFDGGNQFGPGNYGSLYKTVDSGRTWHLSVNFSANSIQFTPDSNVIIGGFGGEILKSAVGGWQVDSLGLVYTSSCGARLSASVGVALGEVDSISFLITAPDSSVIHVRATPNSINNGNIDCFSPDSSFLTPGVPYTARIQFYYNGAYRYSNPVNIVGPGLAAPLVKDSLGWLESSYLTNIWYVDGTVVQGTNAQVWKPQTVGIYSAQATNYACTSAMSDSVTIGPSWTAEPLVAQSTDSCMENFSTILQANLGAVDSITIQITDSLGNSQIIPVNPSLVDNMSMSCTASLSSLTPGVTYSARLRVWFDNAWQYGQQTTFTGRNIPQPTISRNAGMLMSSAAIGNQWYLNNVAIPGAVQQRYTPAGSGTYTVNVTRGACVSAMSDTIDIAGAGTGGTSGTNVDLGVIVYPNPVSNQQLTVINSAERSLLIAIVDFRGTQLYTGLFTGNEISIPVSNLAPGQYILHVRDSNTGETANVRFLKY
jgi:photosystem II stability/assembly factor-like uncharacterized protein